MHLLLVEDELDLAEQIILMLRRANYAVSHVTNAKDAILAGSTNDIDGIVLDLGLPDMDGLELLKQLRGRQVNLPILILTARTGLHDRVYGLDLGADDYLAKPFAQEELLARLRVILRRNQRVFSSTLAYQNVVLDVGGMILTVADEDTVLSKKEFMILRILLESQGRVVSKEKLTNSIYEWGEEVCSNAIEVHISNLRKKLPEQFITTIRGLGYTIK